MAKPISPLKLLIISLISISLFTLLFFFLPHLTPSPPHFHFHHTTPLSNPFPPPPRIAYFITGSDGDAPRILRLLHAVYHPRNHYLLHLDLRASQRQREDLAVMVQSVDVFGFVGNVDVVGKADMVNVDGSTPVAFVIHGAAILRRLSGEWDWFVNLGAGDYPLITQDDFLHVLSFVPKNFNFIEHTSNIGWKEYQRIIQIIVDPGLYLASKSAIFTGSNKRPLPKAFRFFTGSSAVILSREFVEFSILGLDNLPRTLLTYFSNIKSSHRGYFQTLACNTKKFLNTIINSDLRFVAWDNPPKTKPRNLRLSDLNRMLLSGAAFAGTFLPNDRVLDVIDSKVLHRSHGRVVPGGWCIERSSRGRDPCTHWGDIDILRPGPGAKRFEKLLLKLMANTTFHTNSCSPR